MRAAIRKLCRATGTRSGTWWSSTAMVRSREVHGFRHRSPMGFQGRESRGARLPWRATRLSFSASAHATQRFYGVGKEIARQKAGAWRAAESRPGRMLTVRTLTSPRAGSGTATGSAARPGREAIYPNWKIWVGADWLATCNAVRSPRVRCARACSAVRRAISG